MLRSVALLTTFLVCFAVAQNAWDYLPVQPIPPKPPGRTIGNPSAPIYLEAVFDLQCSDSKVAWGVINELLQLYPDSIYFILHVFALSYKENAYWAAQSANVINNKLPDQYFNYIDVIYSNQALFQNSVTFDKSGSDVWAIFQGLTSQVGLDSQTFYDQMNNSTATWQVTREWKWASARGIYSTPSYFVNGVLLSNTLWDIETWAGFIESLLNES